MLRPTPVEKGAIESVSSIIYLLTCCLPFSTAKLPNISAAASWLRS
ncbi:hypothetical protein C2W64_03698 [Brevibacillus laterosporus]|nr:hypothetical protein C2W64_03698 [Brevibacillus laterosporus]